MIDDLGFVEEILKLENHNIDDDHEFLKHLFSLQKCRFTGEIIVIPIEELNMLDKNDIRELLKEISKE